MQMNKRTLGEICDEVGGVIRTGPFGSQLHQSDYQQEGVPVVMPKDIVGEKLSEVSIARIGAVDVTRLSQHILKEGDIVYGRRGDIGRQALITKKNAGWLCGTGCLRISLGNTVLDPNFLHYYLMQEDVIEWIHKQAVGATMPNLNTTILRSVPIDYPPLETQRKIVSILSTYDDLIENNTRRIKNLEEMARMIYREWFVNFRFPGHEQVKMVDSMLGMIPEGWEVGKLQDYMELCYGKALKAEDRKEGPYPVYGSSGVVGFHSEHLVASPGVIVGRKGNVGSVRWTDEPFFPIDTVYYVKTDVSLYYVFYNLQQQNFINNDAAVPGLNRNQAYSLPFILPSEPQLKAFDEFIGPAFKAVRSLTRKNQNLRQTRDLLLPKLISGEVAV